MVVMDAPPPRENIRPFLTVAGIMREAGVRTPGVHAADPEQGFILLDDFGQCCYQDKLNEHTADQLYQDALAALLRLQTGVNPEATCLPHYDEALLWRELDIFREWYLEGHLQLTLSSEESELLDRHWRKLIDSALEQPKVCVHRDYHSRNLMVLDDGNPGVIDFQDAVIGPITYDVVSLLRDCYIEWPETRVHDWLKAYGERLLEHELMTPENIGRFRSWFDLMGMQRHLKAIGIFARLNLRDGKPGYLADIPRTLGYVLRVAESYPEFRDFHNFLSARVLPARNAGVSS